MSVHTEIRIGSDFVGYRIEDLIGQGGMGVVYGAHDLRLKRTVAIKFMAPELALDEGFRARFARETELVMSLEHPNVVPIYDAGDVDGRLYLAMRLVVGTDLGKLLRAEGGLDRARALAICSAVANALDAAHARGLVHRDVKPSNVLLDENEHVYLADFGLTRPLDEQGGRVGDGRSMGTPAYLAPEQIEGEQVDGRADVYSLGCLLYECLTGQTPFHGSRLEMAWAHLEEDPPSASERNPDLPETIDAVIRKAMAKEPESRYATCAGLITAAEEALELRRPALHRHRFLAMAALAILLVVAAVFAAVLVSRGSGGAVSKPVVKEDTLVRINPKTNAVSAVVDVGVGPSATAVGGRSVWVYNRDYSTLSEIDASTNRLRNTTAVSIYPIDCCGVFGGPVLAADTAGAWLIGEQHGSPYLTRVSSGPRGKRNYPLDEEPFAVAVGYGYVWVVTRGARDDHVLRVDRVTGAVTKEIAFPTSSRIDSLAVGLDSVWVVASSSATLYRIDPRLVRVTRHTDLGQRATQPEVVQGAIWVGLTDHGGDTVIVDSRTLDVHERGCCPPQRGADADTPFDGSVWTYDTPTGTVVRWSPHTHQDHYNIHVADPPFYGGPCLTSIAAGAGAVWVTAAPNSNNSC